MSQTTRHGDNIVNQIQSEDAYGQYNMLTLADVWNIVDNLHTHFLDTGRSTAIFEKWMKQLEKMDKDLPL